jgi:hypothetical protein
MGSKCAEDDTNKVAQLVAGTAQTQSTDVALCLPSARRKAIEARRVGQSGAKETGLNVFAAQPRLAMLTRVSASVGPP